MVARSSAHCQIEAAATDAWRRELGQAFTQVDPLLEFLGLHRDQVPTLDPEPGPFRLLVPRGFAALMRGGGPADPLLRQVLPLAAERVLTAGFRHDPVGDGPAARAPGLLRKYAERALLMAQGACAVHCRYCFRRHFPYGALGTYGPRVGVALAQIQADTTLHEVILSGGDPLLLADDTLEDLLTRLAAIPHVRRLRLHSRLPLVLPSRITARLCGLLRTLTPRPVLVIHTNHARELGAAAQAALTALGTEGVTLLNQSVLLRGVNDDVTGLAALSERLFDCGVLPYYLHQLDPVQGAAHFAVSDRQARRLMDALRARLPGYLVPRLVRESAGAPCKEPLS